MSKVKGQRSKVTRRRVYMDYAATTPLDPRARRAMEPFFSDTFGNPSSIHTEGVAGKKAVDAARATVARVLEAHAEEIVFTSGGTESNNLAISGVVEFFLAPPPFQGGVGGGGRSFGMKEDTTPLSLPLERGEGKKKPHVVTTNIEHSSVLEPLRELERQGRIEVSYVPVEQNGIVKAEKVITAIRPNTVLVSVMYANNEIGTIQPIAKIAKQIKDLRLKIKERQHRELKSYNLNLKSVKNRFPVFHTDACQAPLYLNCLVNALGVDLLTLDGHKIYGPKGIGCLYARRGTSIVPQLLGGGQEGGLRSTTENVPAIVGFSEALRNAVAERKKESARLTTLRDYCYSLIRANKRITERVVLNGDMKERLPNNINISLPGVDTEMLTLQLDAAGIACSTKSSCLRAERVSYVVAALGGGRERAQSSLRFTCGRETNKHDIEYCLRMLSTLLVEK